MVHRQLSVTSSPWFCFHLEREPELEAVSPEFFKPHVDSLEHLTQTTYFSRKEVQALYRSFKEHNPTGQITVEKFQEIFSAFFARGDAIPYSQLVFRTFDADKNGTISFEEFLGALSTLLRGSTEERLSWVFTLYDTDNRGFIVIHDVYRIIRSMYDMMGPYTAPPIKGNEVMQHANQIFQKLDVNNDGQITREEFVQCCLKDRSVCESLNLFDVHL